MSNIICTGYDPTPPRVLGQGICSGEWISNITMYDELLVPDVPPGETNSYKPNIVENRTSTVAS